MDASRGGDAVDGTTSPGQLVSTSRAIQPGSLDRALGTNTVPLIYWEDPEGCRLLAIGQTHELSFSSIESTDSIQSHAHGLWDDVRYDGPPVARPRMIGGCSFDGRCPTDSVWRGYPGARFVLPRHLYVQQGAEEWHTMTAPPAQIEPTEHDDIVSEASSDGQQPCILDRSSNPSREQWIADVAKLRHRIEQGAFRKVVMAHALDLSLDRSPTALERVRRLRSANPDCYLFLCRPNPTTMFIAATPERVVEARGDRIRTDVLAGSIRRGDTPADDAELSTNLEDDEKEAHEHRLVVEAIREDLQSLGVHGHEDGRRVRQLRSVQHLHTPISAAQPDDLHVLELVDALHPTPAVGGLPRQPAIDAIREIETFDRGWYAAPIGWFDAAGDGIFAIGIRSAVIQERHARLFAGAGIVRESNPESEWEEVQWKYRPMLDSFAHQ